ncbi:serine hydrolase [Micromonospora sp. NPDC005324]|uniref:serine hydrolase n=1 Tax=Micromonospora sp. NPDC005324 TaxID=3157033 RepID=UPI0033A9C660
MQRFDGHLAMAMLDRQGGARVTVDVRKFQTASIVKVNILAALLLREQMRNRDLSSGARRLAEAMIVASDNDAASTLWREIEGQRGLAAANRTLGLRETRPNTQWGLTTTTAADQIRLLTVMTTPNGPLKTPNCRFILELMGRVNPDQQWGVTAGAEANNIESYVKNGWTTVTEDNNRWLVNSIGRIVEPDRDWLIAVLSDHHVSQEEGIRVVENATRYALRQLRTVSNEPPAGTNQPHP